MNHHLSQADVDFLARCGDFPISGATGLNRVAKMQMEESARCRLISQFQKKMGSAKAAAAYFEVTTTTWNRWRSADRLPPPEVCFSIEKLMKS